MSLVAKISENVHVGAREYLTFRLDQEEYGIDILKVQEIRGYEQPTRIANAPAFCKGCREFARNYRSYRGYAA